MPDVYTWTRPADGVTLPLVIKDPNQGNLLATHISCCCEGCSSCEYLEGPIETCEGEGCVSSDTPIIMGWYETYAEAKQAGLDAGHVWCGDGACCPDNEPCFVVKCSNSSPNKCKRWGVELCCPCCPYEDCDDCATCIPAWPVGPSPADLCVGGDDCGGGYGCQSTGFPGAGFCTYALAVAAAKDAGFPNECTGSNCKDDGCYYITCDDDKCEEKFNWVGCQCQGS